MNGSNSSYQTHLLNEWRNVERVHQNFLIVWIINDIPAQCAQPLFINDSLKRSNSEKYKYRNQINYLNTKRACLYLMGQYSVHIELWLPALFLVVTVTLRTLTACPRSTLHHGWSSKLLKKHDFLWESGLGLESTANWGFRPPNTLLLEVGFPLARSALP